MAELVIDDSNYGDFLPHKHDRLAGCLPRVTRYGDCAHAVPDRLQPIPRDQWDARIKANDEHGAWLYDLAKGIPCQDQDGLGYCHAYSTVMAMMVERIVQGLPLVLLSAESIGGPITGWQNQGAALDQDLQQAAKRGACRQQFMDGRNSISPSRWKAGWEIDCANHIVTEWWDLDSRNTFDLAATCALIGIPANQGFGWWGHAVAGAFKLRRGKGGRYELMSRNSWGKDYGEDGFFWLAEGKGTPDLGLFAPRQVTASEV